MSRSSTDGKARPGREGGLGSAACSAAWIRTRIIGTKIRGVALTPRRIALGGHYLKLIRVDARRPGQVVRAD